MKFDIGDRVLILKNSSTDEVVLGTVTSIDGFDRMYTKGDDGSEVITSRLGIPAPYTQGSPKVSRKVFPLSIETVEAFKLLFPTLEVPVLFRKDAIKHLLSRVCVNYIMAFVSDESEEIALTGGTVVVITDFLEEDGLLFEDTEGQYWRCAVPIDGLGNEMIIFT